MDSVPKRSGDIMSRLIRAVALVAVALALVPSAAFADIYLLPPGSITSLTNPGDPTDFNVTWREGWGNSPLALIDVDVPPPLTGESPQPALVGARYFIERPQIVASSTAPSGWELSPSTITTINVSPYGIGYPSAVESDTLIPRIPYYYNALLVASDKWNVSLDLPGETANPGRFLYGTGSSWTPPTGVAISRPYEGPYWCYFQFYYNPTFMPAGALWYMPGGVASGFSVGLDMTPPERVSGLVARPGADTTVVNGWLTQSRANFSWDDLVYDRLAGTGYFELFMDGKPYPTSATDATSRRVYDLEEHYPGYGFRIESKRGFSIEDLPAGEHVYQVRAVDRATNPGPLSDPVTLKVDPDIPVVTITSPEIDGAKVGPKPTFAANVTDKGGVASVKFYVDGVLKATDTVAPYDTTVDLSSFADRSTHVLRVEATDVVGRVNSAQSTFVIDKTPTVSILAPAVVGVTVGSPALFSANCADGLGIQQVTFAVDGTVVETFTPSANTTSAVLTSLESLPSGGHTLVVTVYSVSGGTMTATRSFVVDSSLPVSTLGIVPPSTETTPLSGTSTTNPYVPTDSLTFWRQLWGNSMQPNFTIASPSFEPYQQAELFYTVDRSPTGIINPNDATTYYRSVKSSGAMVMNIFDQRGILLNRPDLNGTALYPGRVSDPVEGVWFWHLLFKSLDGTTMNYNLPYGIDITKPAMVTGLGIYPDSTSTTPFSGWMAQDRAILRWDNAQQDLLSGTAYYRVYVDGSCLVPGDVPLTDPASGLNGVPWYRTGRAQETLTLEEIGPGIHQVQISAVDRASNESVLSPAIEVKIDVDTPQISITNPTKDGQILGPKSYLSVVASDAAGVSTINYAIDGTSIGTIKVPGLQTSYSASLLPAWSKFSNGTHEFAATVTDMGGRTSTVRRVFVLDRKTPTVTIKSAGPHTFYPRLRDGYKDNYTIKFKSSEIATATLQVVNGDGKVVHTMTKSVKANTYTSFVWDGTVSTRVWTAIADADQAKTFTYKVRVKLVDRGNNTKTSKSSVAHIKLYEVVKTGPDSVKIVPR